MASGRPGAKPLSEPMLESLLMHVCVTRPRWVKPGNSPAPLNKRTYHLTEDIKKYQSHTFLLNVPNINYSSPVASKYIKTLKSTRAPSQCKYSMSRHGDFHYKYTTVVRSSYFHNLNPYIGKTTPIYCVDYWFFSHGGLVTPYSIGHLS